MSLPWYEEVPAETPLLQGDILMDCPLLEWDSDWKKFEFDGDEAALQGAVEGIKADVVVMTQACDLENWKVPNVLVCPHTSLEDFLNDYKAAQGDKFAIKSWRNRCKSIKEGTVWNLSMLKSRETGDIRISHRIVEFRNVYTIPRSFLESWQTQIAKPRLRLLPPYREHLSQAFARFFMRVGLPSAIETPWDYLPGT
jgi:hypothetical protein